jgi:hypothetical protein
VTPKPIVEHHEGDQPGEEKEAGGQSYYTINNAVGKNTEVVIPEPKYAPLVYKSLYQQHQSLHHSDEQEEPKNVSQRLQITIKGKIVQIIKKKDVTGCRNKGIHCSWKT